MLTHRCLVQQFPRKGEVSNQQGVLINRMISQTMDSFPPITDQEFKQFQQFIHEMAGIYLPPVKKVLVAARLSKRLRHYHFNSYAAYFKWATDPEHAQEQQMMIDLLTTNETYFFREPEHFEFLRKEILPNWHGTAPFRAWSAVCSSGEEAYTLAMVLMDFFGERTPWEVLGSDISQRMLDIAVTGHYPITADKMPPPPYLSRFCLKGVRTQAGSFLIDPAIRRHVQFRQINLNKELPTLGSFDVIFLRNVLIYFDQGTKQRLLHRLLPLLRSGGYCFFGHAESLIGIADEWVHNVISLAAPTVYRKH